MSHWVNKLSDHDDEERARIERVAAQNPPIFQSLMKALRERVSTYNDRHRQDFGFPNAICLNESPYHPTVSSVKVQKNTEPQSSLTLEFPINSGAMEFRLSSSAGKWDGTIKIDIRNNTPTFYSDDGKRHSAESLADALLLPMFTTDGVSDIRRQIGFLP